MVTTAREFSALPYTPPFEELRKFSLGVVGTLTPESRYAQLLQRGEQMASGKKIRHPLFVIALRYKDGGTIAETDFVVELSQREWDDAVRGITLLTEHPQVHLVDGDLYKP